MELVVLGSGTAVPSLERASAGYLLDADGRMWIFDTGLGTLHRLLQAGVDCERIDRIFFSHAHVDHHLEIVHILFQNNYFLAPRTRDLHIYGSEKFLEFFRGLRDLYGNWIEPRHYRLRCHDLTDREIGIDGFKVATRAVAHIPSSVAYRVRSPQGRVFVYSGDTDRCASLIELARDADLLLTEASTPDAMKAPGHLTPALAGEIATRAGVKRLLLTHFYPPCESIDVKAECRRTYAGEILLAEDLLRVSI